MKTSTFPEVEYKLGDLALNKYVGSEIEIKFTGNIECIECGRKINKTYSQGYCFPCSQKLACCDLCIVRPERCHFHKGTCREPEWGKENCLIEHSVYLANTAGVKVGITRSHQKFTRWADQGATEALEIARVPERLIAGKFEEHLKEFFSDRADWRKLVTGKELSVDLEAALSEVREKISADFKQYLLSDLKIEKLKFPVIGYPEKAVSFNEKKEKEIKGDLSGIRGQYLLFPDKVINIRKFQGYEMEAYV